MEARKVTIYQTRTQSMKPIMSSATTLAELKADLRANDIDYADMDFFEGTTKTTLVSDESLLPHDIPYRGQITNDIVIMLTNSKKKIRSGNMTRMEAYAAIKANNLQAQVKEKFGKNFTMCKTEDLLTVIADVKNTVKTKAKKAVKPAVVPTEVVDVKARKAIKELVYLLQSEDIDVSEVLDIFDDEQDDSGLSYSRQEIKDMFKGWAD